MPLKIIKGPPNSGRTELVRQAYIESLSRQPVMVVPGTDDIFGWEERLTREAKAFLGGQVMHFKDLVNEILGYHLEDQGRPASALRRRDLARQAIASGWPGLAGRLDSQPGLIDATLTMVDELRANLIDPATFKDRIGTESSDFLFRIGSIFEQYSNELDRLGLTDESALATEAMARPLDEWAGRPVFVAGFDDLTELQLQLLSRLADKTDVTIAITHEENNPAMAVTDTLLARLMEHGSVVATTTRETGGGSDDTRFLREIERRFMRETGPGADPLKVKDPLTVLYSSGRRGEAEAVGAEIATLISTGTSPDEIAVAVNAPAVNGSQFRDLLDEYGIPTTLGAETPVSATAVGQAVLDLLRAAGPGGTAAALLRYLRGPTGADLGRVDRTEYLGTRQGIRSARELAAIFTEVNRGGEPPFWKQVSSEDPVEAVTGAIKEMVRIILRGDSGQLPGPGLTVETQMATAMTRALEDLRGIESEKVTSAQILDALLSGAVKTWAMPVENTVRIASPYSIRAKRFEHLFVVSLQESDPGAGDTRGGPLLGPAVRETVGIPQPTDAEEQERYLFHSCLSVPTEGLWLSARVADDHGRAEQPSPLIDAVLALFDGPKTEDDATRKKETNAVRRLRRTGADLIFTPGRAPSEVELTRSLAATGATETGLENGDGATVAAGLIKPDWPEIIARANRHIRSASEVETDTRVLPPLSNPEVLADLQDRDTFSATALEAFTSCPYRWFIDRALRLQRFGPDPDAMARGDLIHRVLAAIYGEHPGELPRPDTLTDWLTEVVPAIERVAALKDVNLASDSAVHRVIRHKAASDISAQIRLDAARVSPGFEPELYEASFGMNEDDKDPLDLGAWKLRGSIDRIDVSGAAGIGLGQRGVVIDYKSGYSSVKSWVNTVRERKLQLQLYMKALKDLWEIEPVAGLYQPVAPGDRRPRGLIDKDSAGDLDDMNPYKEDREDVDAAIEAAVTTAGEAVALIHAGRIDHDPLTCVNHFQHAAVPDWKPDSGDQDDGGGSRE